MTTPIKQAEKKYLMPVYNRFDLSLKYGNGCYLYDEKGNKYLDFLGGVATCAIGHNNTQFIRAVGQSAGFVNASNLFYTQKQLDLAKKILKYFGDGLCFFSNSGTEANEAAIKLARKYTGKYEMISFVHGFHGRTFGSLSATGKEKIQTPFKPLLPGFKHVPYDDISALKRTIDKKTAAVIIEPIQGEAGVVVPKYGYLEQVAKLCQSHLILLIVDEVQTGIGRTGKFFAHAWENIQPDIVTLAKGLANGVPIGVTVAKSEIARAFAIGDHGSTFGGNNLSCSAALAVLDFIDKNDLIKNAAVQGKYFLGELKKIKSEIIVDVRGKGLMIAIQTKNDCRPVAESLISYGLICGCAGDNNVIRFLPPLIVEKKHIDKAIKILKQVL